MKDKGDLVRAWIRKAESDLWLVQMCLEREKSFEAGCFHAQQAAEKYLKAYLTAFEVEFPFIHNLEKLVQICSGRDPTFLSLKRDAEELTPYAVQARYDTDFWPCLDTVRAAWQAARTIKDFVLSRLPQGIGTR